jgi:hypothetical protein
MKIKPFTFLLFFFVQNCFAQVQKLSARQMGKDLDVLNKHLRKWHPTYYAYTEKEEMNAFYDSLKTVCAEPKTTREFRQIIHLALNKVGCGHIGLQMPKKMPSLDSINAIPFDVFLLKNRLFVRKYYGKDTVFKVGDELTKINNVSAQQLIKNLGNFISSDGFNTTHKEAVLEQYFPIYYYLAQGQITEFKIKTSENNAIKSIAATKRSTSVQQFVRNRSDSTNLIIKGNGIALYKVDFDTKTMLIDFKSFLGKGQQRTYAKIFKYLRQNDVQNLIVDLRDNGGGNVFKGNNFLKYFHKSTFFACNLTRKPNLTIINPKFKAGFFVRITPLFFMLNPLQYPSKRGWHHVFPFVKKFKNHYDNKTYVITNGRTFSMAAYAASVLKNKVGATTFGEESGGSNVCSRGMAGGKIKLPNSKMMISLNVYNMRYNRNEKDNGHGVMPDYEVNYTIQEKIMKVDLELDKIKELIEK